MLLGWLVCSGLPWSCRGSRNSRVGIWRAAYNHKLPDVLPGSWYESYHRGGRKYTQPSCWYFVRNGNLSTASSHTCNPSATKTQHPFNPPRRWTLQFDFSPVTYSVHSFSSVLCILYAVRLAYLRITAGRAGLYTEPFPMPSFSPDSWSMLLRGGIADCGILSRGGLCDGWGTLFVRWVAGLLWVPVMIVIHVFVNLLLASKILWEVALWTVN